MFVKRNLCTGAENTAFHKAIFLEISAGVYPLDQLDFVVFSSPSSRKKVRAVRVNEDKYYYENIFGKTRHYEQFMLNDGGTDKNVYYMVLYPARMFDQDLPDAIHAMFSFKNGTQKQIDIPIKGQYPDYDFYTFATRIHHGTLQSRLISGPETPLVNITYHLAAQGGAKKTYETFLPYQQAMIWHDAPVHADQIYDYVGIYYDIPHDVRERDWPGYRLESKVEVWAKGDLFYQGCAPEIWPR
jgi:hypothetical protein